MRLIDADELMEHVYRDKLDSRELIAEMVKNAPTVTINEELVKRCQELSANTEYLRSENSKMAEEEILDNGGGTHGNA